MPEKPGRKIILPPGGGVFQDLTLRVKLILRLIGDGRVNVLLKLLPIGSLVYLVLPDLAVGPIDDAAIIWLATYLFVELCPAGCGAGTPGSTGKDEKCHAAVRR